MFLTIQFAFSTALASAINEAVRPYYVSPNRLDFEGAESFCQHRCESHLASIHSDAEYQRCLAAIAMDINHDDELNKNVWIGMDDRTSESEYRFTDGTAFDFATNFSGGVYPWKTNNPNNANPNNGIGGQNCIQLSATWNYLWDDTECTNANQVMCNECNTINKYIVMDMALSFADAQHFCRQSFHTDLASIHSSDDNDEAMFLCSQLDGPCWIGLYTNADVLQWTDGSDVNYGNDMNVDGAAQHATVLSNDAWEMLAVQNEHTHYFLCNSPSELCAHSSWYPILSDVSVLLPLGGNECELFMNTTLEKHILFLADKQWMNSNDEVVVQYMFSADAHSTDDSVAYSAGVALFNSDPLCDYYEIGVTFIDHLVYVYVSKRVQYMQRWLQVAPITQRLNRYFALQIHVVNGSEFRVSIDGVQYLSVVDSEPQQQGTNVAHSYSGAIGLYACNLNVLAKSLYVSGTPVTMDQSVRRNFLQQCPAMMDMETTLSKQTEYGVLVSIAIDENATNVSESMITALIADRMKQLRLDDNCLISQHTELGSTSINVSIFLCSQQAQYALAVDLRRTLQANQTSYIAIVIFNTANNVSDSTHMYMYSTISDDESSSVHMKIWDLLEDGSIWWLICASLAVTLCIAALCVCLVCRCRKYIRRKADDEIGGGRHINLMPIKASSLSTDIDSNSTNNHQRLRHKFSNPHWSYHDDYDVEDSWNWNNDHDPSVPLKKTKRKRTDSLIIRYVGDDEKFQKRLKNKK